MSSGIASFFEPLIYGDSRVKTDLKRDSSETTSDKNFLHIDTFTAEASNFDRVSRVVNNLVFAGVLWAGYTVVSGGTLGVAHITCMALASRKVLSSTIGFLAYPSALMSLFHCGSLFYSSSGVDEAIERLEGKGFVTKKVRLYKSGTGYEAVLAGHKSTINNGSWAVNAMGNAMTLRGSLEDVAKSNYSDGMNTLLINGPAVGASGGWPTRYQLGAGVEAGLQFLENKVGARKIIMKGLSLGGGMVGEAIVQHDFSEGLKKGVRYLCISDRSFSCLSDTAGALVTALLKPLFYLAGQELDGVAAAKKLTKLGIQHIIVQHKSPGSKGSDGVIPDRVSLAHALHNLGDDASNRVFLESGRVSHNWDLPMDIQTALWWRVKRFMYLKGW